MSRFDEALTHLQTERYRQGSADMRGNANEIAIVDSVVAAAESAVRAIHEEDEALIGELEKALKDMCNYHLCDNCTYPYTDCKNKDCREIAESANAVLLKVANRNKPQGGVEAK